MRLTEAKQTIREVIAAGPFRANWESLKPTMSLPGTRTASSASSSTGASTRFRRFGNEWYPATCISGTEEFAHHVETYGPQSKLRLQELHPPVHGGEVRPRWLGGALPGGGRSSWCRSPSITTDSPCTTSAFSDWNAVKMGPRRDVIGELADAVRGNVDGLRRLSHRADTGGSSTGGMKFDSDVQDPRYADFYGPAQRRG